jgi:hypothetical protein
MFDNPFVNQESIRQSEKLLGFDDTDDSPLNITPSTGEKSEGRQRTNPQTWHNLSKDC